MTKCIWYVVAGAVGAPIAMIAITLPIALSIYWFDNPIPGFFFLLSSAGALFGASMCHAKRGSLTPQQRQGEL